MLASKFIFFLTDSNIFLLNDIPEKGKSFTGDESVEITCHGSTYIQKTIVETLLEN